LIKLGLNCTESTPNRRSAAPFGVYGGGTLPAKDKSKKGNVALELIKGFSSGIKAFFLIVLFLYVYYLIHL
jgi:hypothetical protein